MPIELTTAPLGTINGIRDTLLAPSETELATETTTRAAADVSLDSRVDTLEVTSTRALALHHYNFRAGTDWVSGGSTINAADFHMMPRTLPPGRLRAVRIHTSSFGAFAIVLVRNNGDGTYTILDSKAVTTAASGLVTLRAGIELPNWILDGSMQIGIQHGSGGIPGTRYTDTGGSGSFGVVGTASGVITSPSYVQTAEFYYTVDVAAEELRAGGATLEKAEFGCLPEGWVQGAAPWTFYADTKAAGNTGTGVTNMIRSGISFALDERELIWEFGFTPGSAIGFVTYPTEGALFGSMIRVDAGAQALQIFSLYTGVNTPTQITSVPAVITPGVRYMLRWRKSGRTYTATLTTRDGTIVATITRTASPRGYVLYPGSYDNDQGNMQGRAGVFSVTGEIGIYSFEHRAIAPPGVNLYMAGDSLTEGFPVLDSEKWVNLVIGLTGGPTLAVSSGNGGADTGGAMARVAAEIQALRPKNVLLYFGTNADGSFAANIRTMATAARAANCQVYIGTIPTSATNTNTVMALPGWVNKIRFDYALTASGAGSAMTTIYFTNTDAGGNAYTDPVHPNAAGHIVMKNRVVLDAPALFRTF